MKAETTLRSWFKQGIAIVSRPNQASVDLVVPVALNQDLAMSYIAIQESRTISVDEPSKPHTIDS